MTKRLRERKAKIRREFERMAAAVLFTAVVFAIGNLTTKR